MWKISQFMKVSQSRFEADWLFACPCPYDELRLPRRATKGSAGYDFFSPVDFTLSPGEFIRIPTGVRVQIDAGWVLMLYPRSGQGFKYRLQLYNSVGIIDSDYFDADNEGHIQIKIVNANEEGKTLVVRKGEAFAQGVFLPFGITMDDDAEEIRTGGFGSTDRQ